MKGNNINKGKSKGKGKGKGKTTVEKRIVPMSPKPKPPINEINQQLMNLTSKAPVPDVRIGQALNLMKAAMTVIENVVTGSS